jgi:hypothetical protein
VLLRSNGSVRIAVKSKIKIITKAILHIFLYGGFFMCGIVGYIGKDKCIPKIIYGLESLEYRGYDSAGIAYKKGKKII